MENRLFNFLSLLFFKWLEKQKIFLKHLKQFEQLWKGLHNMGRFLVEAEQKQCYILMPFCNFMKILFFKQRYFLTEGFSFKEGNKRSAKQQVDKEICWRLAGPLGTCIVLPQQHCTWDTVRTMALSGGAWSAWRGVTEGSVTVRVSPPPARMLGAISI